MIKPFTRAALAAAFLLFAATASARPNIVFIMVDDLDVSVWDKALELGLLPNIKTRLVDQGTSFKQMFTSQPTCCPSRATLQTGMYPQNHNVYGNREFYDRFQKERESKALGTWLKESGHLDGTYRTGLFGKFMNGSGKDPYHVPPGWDVWRALVPKSPIQCMYGYSLANSGAKHETFGGPTDPKNFQTDKLAELAINFIRDPDPRPFLAVITPTSPHIEECDPKFRDRNHQIRTAPRYATQVFNEPLPAASLPSFDEADMTDKPHWMQKNLKPLGAQGKAELTKLFNERLAALRPVDDLVKGVLDELKAQGKESNTLVIFTSDNGYLFGPHRHTGKQELYEEATRVPMVVRAPSQTTPCEQQSWVMNNDWAPTIADYAEVKPLLDVDGRSFRALVESPNALGDRQSLMIRTGPNEIPRGGGRDVGEHYPYQAIRTHKPALTGDPTGKTVLVYGYTYNFDGTFQAEELYDLTIDPYQVDSLHASTDPLRIAQIARLKQRLMELKFCKGAACQQLENN